MNEATVNRPPVWFSIVSVLALLWNLMGMIAFVLQITMSEEAMAALPEQQQQLYKDLPAWVTVAFGAAVIGGAIGSLGLVLRKRWATPVLVVSLLGVLSQMTYAFFLSDMIQVMGGSAAVRPIFVMIIAIALVVLGPQATSRGWLS